MTPGTRLLNAARASTRNPSPREVLTERERELLDAVEALSDARALYPAAHAIGERVSVVYPLEMREAFATQQCKDFTGIVTGVEFHPDGVDYRVTGDGDPDYTVVDSAFVHPAPPSPNVVTLPAKGDIKAGQAVVWNADGTVSAVAVEAKTTGGFLINTASPIVQQAAMEAFASASPSWFPMDGRRVTESSADLGDTPPLNVEPVRPLEFRHHQMLTPGGSTNTLLIPNRVQITHRTDEHGVKTTETVDLRDPDDLHARFAEALGREWRGMRDGKHIRAEWLAAFERAVEIAGEVYKLGQRGR